MLGKEQHGHMSAVGYDLYCKMLNEAVKTLKGISTVEDFNTSVDLDVDAFIPPSYIVNEIQKLDIYKRIASVENQTECDDMKEELLDRFGEIPASVDNLLRISMIRVQAHRLFISEIRGKNEQIRFILRPDANIKVECIPNLLQAEKNLSFNHKGTPEFIYKYKKTGMLEKDEQLLLEYTENLIKTMTDLIGLA